MATAKAGKTRAGKAKAAKPKAKKATARTRKVSEEQQLAKLVEDAVDRGATTAEEIHRAIMELPVTVLESLGMPNTAKRVKKVQDSSIGALYDLIRDINRKVAALAKDLLKQRKARMG